MSSEKILITGSTGKIGIHLVKDLLSKGASIRLYVRNKSKALTTFTDPNIEYAEGANEDLVAFANALKGIDRLFLLSLNYGFEVEMAKTAAAAGVKHIVKLSCIFADLSAETGTIMQQHGKAEYDITAAVGKQVAITYLRPHDFMENTLGKAASAKTGAIYSNYGTAAISSISAKRYRRIRRRCPESLTQDDLATIIGQVSGRVVKHVNVDEKAVYETLLGYGIPGKYALLLAYLGVTYRERLPTGQSFLSGREPQSFKEFLEENKAVFV
ncbi:hypothetical protein BC829DRAFT_387449 [Chytridium lagenaria]|nr:hypothetical protein BC829DRAFT_387449 [Chytridium lagenaria]